MNSIFQHQITIGVGSMEIDELALILLGKLLNDWHFAIYDHAIADGPAILKGRNW